MEEKVLETQNEELEVAEVEEVVEEIDEEAEKAAREAEEKAAKEAEIAAAEEESKKESIDRKRSKYTIPVVRDVDMLKTFVKFSNEVGHPRATGYMVIVGGTMFVLPFINHDIALPGVIICHVMGALMVLLGVFRHQIGVSMLKSNPQTKLGEELVYLFGSTGVKVEKDGKVEHIGSYKKIYRIWEDEKHFYVGMDTEDLLVLPKWAFETGDYTTFRDFIVEKSRCSYVWKPTRIDNVIKDLNMKFKMKTSQIGMGFQKKNEK